MKINQKGMTLAEVLVSLLLVSLVIFATVAFITTSYQATRNTQEKEFATQKAMSILDELKSYIEDKQGVGSLLDDFNDPDPVTVLTIQKLAVEDDPISGNIPLATPPGWMFERQITVTPLGDQDNRLVNVKLFTNRNGFRQLIAEVASVLRTIAPSFSPTQVYDVYLIAIDNIPGWWVYMSNIVPFVQSTLQDIQTRNPGLEFRPHWIRKLSYGRDWQYTPYFNDAADSYANINKVYFYPGKLPANDGGYDTPFNKAPVGYYYLPSLFQARINVDGVIKNDFDSTNNPRPYAIADMYNNAMRYPDEKAWFDARVSFEQELADAPTYRLLIEDMWQNPAKYRNAIIINLHGELFPFPPVRNYSDPAKDPDVYTTFAQGHPRAVTHPQQLRYDNDDDLKLRVYSFLHNPAGTLNYLNVPITVRLKNINWVPAANQVSAIIGGTDQDSSGVAEGYQFLASAPVCPVAQNQMCYTPTIDGSDTVIELYNSTLKTPPLITAPCPGPAVCGLPVAWRLYGMEYIPAPMEIPDSNPNTPFSTRNLTEPGSWPKNTARWILTVPDSVLGAFDDKMITIETRIGTDPDTGTMWPTKDKPQNLSRTYVWRGTDEWIFGDGTFAKPGHLPLTERFQTLGDPRHLPYADLKQLVAYSPAPNPQPLGNGFNRYFDDFHNPANGNRSGGNAWQGWAVNGVKNANPPAPWVAMNSDDGWDVTEQADINVGFGQQGFLEVDVNRIMQMFRTVLLRTHSVFTTLSGFSFSYLGLGNEIDYDQSNKFLNGVPVSSMPYTGAGGNRYEKSITSYPTDLSPTYHVKYIKRNNNTWFARYWIGELFPDDVYTAQWDTALGGNLTAGPGLTDFLRVIRSSIPDGASDLLPIGTTFVPVGRSTDEEGCTAFFNIGTTPFSFHHQWSSNDIDALVDQTGDLTNPAGVEIANSYNLPLPTTAPIGRPFRLNASGEGRAPDHFAGGLGFYDTGYIDSGTSLVELGVQPTATLTTEYYETNINRYGSDGIGSGLVTLRETLNGAEAGALYTVVNGLDKTGEAGSVLIGKWSVVSLTHSFLTGGLGASDTRIRELPQILILPFADSELNNKATLVIDWAMNWVRWDGQQYTADPGYAGFDEDTNTSHVVLYSTDNGVTWKNAKTDLAATPGVRPAVGDFVETGHFPTDHDLTWTWNAFGNQCEGSILLRVEAYRDTLPQHYSYHQMRIFDKDPPSPPVCP